ncbi:putative ammonium transporter 3 [Lingula anatina]|uniref:Ammonium transporter n=1 Tax=Lingula anatina TaxID=7574 RepID=A0A1S3IJT0_LINAN|nr:putative ammonium transporter 3 [Lingula anatina]|eukprot:XP_013397764.1 putative ammonium transporter 3 [Lingula anatina]
MAGFNKTLAADENLSYFRRGSLQEIEQITWDDATWILTSSFIIFTMQSGFGLLESGAVHGKNEVNIMVKNAVDVIFGGITFWMVGFGLAFGDGPWANPFCGIGYFLVDSDESKMGWTFAWFTFQMSFATTSTTIVSGAMAERTKLLSYIVFSTFNTFIYCFPTHWLWSPVGFLQQLGAIDFAGSGVVHLVGGTTGLVATLMLKPRIGRYEPDYKNDMANPTNALLGLFMLWWGWLGFNCGSTFGISGGKWKLAARSAVVTVNGSAGGGAVGIFLSYIFRQRKLDIGDLVNSVLGALVSVTAICGLARPWEGLIIGMLGGGISVLLPKALDKMKIDDPVGVVSVHGVCGVWGLLSVGLFVDQDNIQNLTYGRKGAFRGGGFYLLGVQTLAAVVIIVWSAVTSFLLLKVLLRVTEEEELLGADYVEHGIGRKELVITPVRHFSTASRRTTSDQEYVVRRRSAFGLSRPIEVAAIEGEVFSCIGIEKDIAETQSLDQSCSKKETVSKAPLQRHFRIRPMVSDDDIYNSSDVTNNETARETSHIM